MSFHALDASKSKCIATVLVLLVLVGLVASHGLLHVVSAQPYYPYGGGLVAGYVLGFNVYDELIPISWASITATVDSQIVGVTSSLGGGYFEMFLPVGFYNLTVEEYGFISKTMQIFVSSGSSTTLQFILEQGQRIYTYPVTVNIVGFSSDYYSNLRVDGKYEGIVQGGRSKTLMFRLGSTHQLDVDPYVKGPSGVRYYSTTVNQTVNGKDSITFTYQPEYYLHLEKRIIDFSSIEGWYREGSLVKIPSAPQYVNGTLGVRYFFEYWMVDGTKVVGNPVSVVIDRPHNVSTRYRTQYYVDVKSEYGNPTGSGWFDANSTVTVSVTTPQGLGVQRVFDRWEGDQVSTSPAISILVDSPKMLTAVWHDDYTQVYAVILIILAALIFAALSVRSRKRVEAKIEPKS